MTGYRAPNVADGRELLERLRGSDTQPLVVIARDGADVEILTGTVVDVEELADIPLLDADGLPQEVFALVPYRQVRERGFECHDDGAPLRCVIVTERGVVAVDALIVRP